MSSIITDPNVKYVEIDCTDFIPAAPQEDFGQDALQCMCDLAKAGLPIPLSTWMEVAGLDVNWIPFEDFEYEETDPAVKAASLMVDEQHPHGVIVNDSLHVTDVYVTLSEPVESIPITLKIDGGNVTIEEPLSQADEMHHVRDIVRRFGG